VSAALTFSFVVPLVLIALVLLVVVVLVDRRDDADPAGKRPYAAYVFVVVFVALFTVLFSVTAMVGSLAHLAVDDNGGGGRAGNRFEISQDFSGSGEVSSSFGSSSSSDVPTLRSRTSSDSDNAHIRDAVRAGLLAAAAAAVLWFHIGLARPLVDELDVTAGPARRVYNAYLYATTTLAVIVVVGGATAFGYAVFKVLAPGVASGSGVGDRKDAVPDLVAAAVLTAGAALIFLYHYRRRPSAPVAALPPAPLPPPPPPPPPERAARPAPAAKKAAPRRPRRTE
jgi:hypothetical protein